MELSLYCEDYTAAVASSMRCRWCLLHRRLISLLYFSCGGINCVSCDICVYHLWFVCVFPWGIPQLQSDCPVTTDLIMRVNVRTTTTCVIVFFFFTYVYFPASGQAVVTGVAPSSPRFLPSIFIAHRVQPSPWSSIFSYCIPSWCCKICFHSVFVDLHAWCCVPGTLLSDTNVEVASPISTPKHTRKCTNSITRCEGFQACFLFWRFFFSHGSHEGLKNPAHPYTPYLIPGRLLG